MVNNGRHAEARQLLKPAVEMIPEGRSLPDFVYAETLLKTLGD
jgi:hypothetical protein